MFIELALPAINSIFASVSPIKFASFKSLLRFAIPRATQIPRYLKALILLYQLAAPESQTRKYVTSALLILGGILPFMAHSFVPFSVVPILGTVTTPIALLICFVVILTTLDLIMQLNEPYLQKAKAIYPHDIQNMQDDLLTIKAQMGTEWEQVTQRVKKIFDNLLPKIIEKGEEIAKEINKYFSKQIPELVLYLDPKSSTKITLNESEIKTITESLEPWKKVGASLILGAGSGMVASTVAKVFVFSGRAVAATVAGPIAVGLTIGTGVFSATMFALGKMEEKKLSQFLADVIICSIPMLRADGKVSLEEKNAVIQLLNNPQINQKDKNRVQIALNSKDSFDEIITKNLLQEDKQDKSEIKRRLIIAITWEIAKADGNIDDQEVALHDRMAKILQVPQECVDEIRRIITPSVIMQHKTQSLPVPVRVSV